MEKEDVKPPVAPTILGGSLKVAKGSLNSIAETWC
jgi:hypothetical protein